MTYLIFSVTIFNNLRLISNKQESMKARFSMIMTNIESVPGKKITSLLGMVSGSTVRAKHAGRDICASFKNFFGGEIKGYTELMEESRKEATQRMVQQATKLGANAVINVRYATSAIAAGAAEVYAYGTAVKVDDIQPKTQG